MFIASGTLLLVGCDSSGGVAGTISEEPSGQVDTTTAGGDNGTGTENPVAPRYPFAFQTKEGVYVGYLSDLSTLRLLPETSGMMPVTFDHAGNVLVSTHFPECRIDSWSHSNVSEIVSTFLGVCIPVSRYAHRHGTDLSKLVLNEPDHQTWNPDVSVFDLDSGEMTRIVDGATPIGVASAGRIITLHGEGEKSDSAYVRIYDTEAGQFESEPILIPGLRTTLAWHVVVAHHRQDIDLLVVSARGTSLLTGEPITAVYLSRGLEPLEMVFTSTNSLRSVFPSSRNILYAEMMSVGVGRTRTQLIRIDVTRRDNTFDVVLPEAGLPANTQTITEVVFDG